MKQQFTILACRQAYSFLSRNKIRLMQREGVKILLSGTAFIGILAVLGFVGIQIVCIRGPQIRIKNFATPNDFSSIYRQYCVNP